MEDAGDIVERLAVDGVARVRRLENCSQRLRGCQRDRDSNHVGARDHDVDGLLLGEVEDLVEHLLLGRLDLTRVLGGGDGLPDVLAGEGDHSRRRGLDPHQAQHRVRRVLQDPDDGREHTRDDVEWNGKRDGDPLRLLKCDRLGDELTDDDRQVGQDRERDHVGDPARQELEIPRDERLADGAECDAEHRDPDLDGRDEPHRLVHEPERDHRGAATGLGALLEPGASCGDE